VIDAGAPLPPDVTDVVAVTAPATPACAIHERRWSGRLELRVSPGDAGFARITRAHDVDVLLTAQPQSAFFHGNVGSQELGGYVALDEVRLTPERAVVLGGVYVPPSEASLLVSAVRGDRVTVNADALSSTSAFLAGDVPCADLSTSAAPFDPSEAWGGAKELRAASFVRKRDVSLSKAPGDPPALRITVDDALALRKVSVVEQRSGHVRVHWHTREGDFFGWVPASVLGPVARGPKAERMQALDEAAEFGMIGLLGGVAEPAIRERAPAGQPLACRTPVRVLVEIRGHTYAVGRIAPGASFHADPRTDGAVAPLDWPGLPSEGELRFELLGTGTRWLAASRDLVGCLASSTPEVDDDAPVVPVVVR
jgi:hypothetical protein